MNTLRQQFKVIKSTSLYKYLRDVVLAATPNDEIDLVTTVVPLYNLQVSDYENKLLLRIFETLAERRNIKRSILNIERKLSRKELDKVNKLRRIIFTEIQSRMTGMEIV